MAQRTCSVDGCTRPHRAYGRCYAHRHECRDRKPAQKMLPRIGTCVFDGCEGARYRRGWCVTHYNRWRMYGDAATAPRRSRSRGGGFDSHGYVRMRVGDRRVGVHVLVMEEHLGRQLLLNERIHHRNGQRADNRIENLELWAHATQPSGQRVVDLLAWAREIIATYGPVEDRLTSN